MSDFPRVVTLQGVSPGVAQVGNISISGTVQAGSSTEYVLLSGAEVWTVGVGGNTARLTVRIDSVTTWGVGKSLTTDSDFHIYDFTHTRSVFKASLMSGDVTLSGTIRNNAADSNYTRLDGGMVKTYSLADGAARLEIIVADVLTWGIGKVLVASSDFRIHDFTHTRDVMLASLSTGAVTFANTVNATTFVGALTGNASSASDGVTSATGTAPLTLGLAAKAITGSISITTTNDGGAVVKQAATPGTAQTGHLNISGAVRAGSLGIGENTDATYNIIRLDGNAATALIVKNITSNTAAAARLLVQNDVANGHLLLQANSTGYTTSGAYKALCGMVGSGSAMSGGLTISTEAGPIIFYTGGTTDAKERMRIQSTGNVVFGIHDGGTGYYFERYSSGYPYASVTAGSADNNVAVGLGLQYRDSTGAVQMGVYIAGEAKVGIGTASFTAVGTTGRLLEVASPSGSAMFLGSLPGAGAGAVIACFAAANTNSTNADKRIGAFNFAEAGDTQSGEWQLYVRNGTGWYLAINVKKTGSVILSPGALAANATDGFVYIPTCAGAPSGTPTSYTGTVPFIFDTSNGDLYVNNSGWKKIHLA